MPVYNGRSDIIGNKICSAITQFLTPDSPSMVCSTPSFAFERDLIKKRCLIPQCTASFLTKAQFLFRSDDIIHY